MNGLRTSVGPSAEFLRTPRRPPSPLWNQLPHSNTIQWNTTTCCNLPLHFTVASMHRLFMWVKITLSYFSHFGMKREAFETLSMRGSSRTMVSQWHSTSFCASVCTWDNGDSIRRRRRLQTLSHWAPLKTKESFRVRFIQLRSQGWAIRQSIYIIVFFGLNLHYITIHGDLVSVYSLLDESDSILEDN